MASHARAPIGATLLEFVVELLVIHVNAQGDIARHHTRARPGYAERGKIRIAQHSAAVATVREHEDPHAGRELLSAA